MDHYRRLSRVNGQIQVVGDTAIRVDQSGSPIEYTEKGYTIAEEINLGLGNRFSIPAAPSPTASSILAVPSPNNVSLPFMAQRLTIPSSVSLFLMMTSAKIAAIDLIDGDPITADVFSEVSLNNGVRWPTANTGQQIQLQAANTDPAAAHEPRISLTGVRLR
jgi:hypothetical protein